VIVFACYGFHSLNFKRLQPLRSALKQLLTILAYGRRRRDLQSGESS
jgi:hypothetical protein